METEEEQKKKTKESFFSFLYTKSRALPKSTTIAFSSPKLAKPPALPPPPPHEGRNLFSIQELEIFRACRSKNSQLRLREAGAAVPGRRRLAAGMRRPCSSGSWPRNEPEPSRLQEDGRRRLRSRRHELRSDGFRLLAPAAQRQIRPPPPEGSELLLLLLAS